MAGDAVQTPEQTEVDLHNLPAPTREKEGRPDAGAALPTPSGDAPPIEPVLPASEQDAIRSVFVARTTAAGAASVESFAQMETTDDGLAIRRAYRAHLSGTEGEAVAGQVAGEGDVVRRAYLARTVAEVEAQRRPVRRSQARRPKKATATKAKGRAARASSAKPKKLGGRRGKPRATTRRARGKRRRR